MAWPINIVDAIPKPKTKEISMNMTMLPFAVAASASSPKDRPTQMALIDPFSDCNIDDPSVGNANKSIVLAIDPWVRSCCLPAEVLSLNVFPLISSLGVR